MSTYLETHPQRLAQWLRVRRNGATPSGVVVVHDTESGWRGGAEACARFITTRTNYGSYHDLVGVKDGIVRMVPYSGEAFHDTGTNNHSYGVSGAYKITEWDTIPKADRDELVRNMARAAAGYAKWLKATHGIDIPARKITRDQSRARVPGFLGHGESDPGRRTDPGPKFPWDLFLATYKAEMAPTEAVKGVTHTPAPTTATTSEEGDTMRHYIITNGGHQYWLNPRNYTLNHVEARGDKGAGFRAEVKTIVEATGDSLHNWRDRPNAGTASDEFAAVQHFTYVGPDAARPKGV